jgi:hypothetical protein
LKTKPNKKQEEAGGERVVSEIQGVIVRETLLMYIRRFQVKERQK